MDLQEFQEADVLWPENSDVHRTDEEGGGVDGDAMACNAAASVLARVSCSPELSVPVHVPRRKRQRRSRSWTSDQSTDGSCSGDDDGGGDVGWTNDAKRTVLPPHVLVARRRKLGGRTAAAYSMCAGKGRTLKGRDLRNVRNLVLEMTGFIEK